MASRRSWLRSAFATLFDAYRRRFEQNLSVEELPHSAEISGAERLLREL
jgi:hypothetical protein